MAQEAQEKQFDVIDRDLMQILVDDARTPTEVIAAQLNISPEDVEHRINELEGAGIIKVYRAVVDPYLYSLYFWENGPLGDKARTHEANS